MGSTSTSPKTSQTGTRTLRIVLAGVTAVLLVVVIGFIWIAHHRAANWLAGLPQHLGVDIQQETNGFTYSQSSKGRKIFTLHASKEVQRKDGKIAFHDVGIVLFGPDGQATDRIHGQDFELDQKAQRMTAQGEVYIDLVPPAGGVSKGDEESRTVHVKTIGLDFDQKEQMATSDGAVEFHTGGYAGNALGASYDAKNGVVVMRSAVRMSGLRNDRPVVLTAARAEMDRQTNVVDLQSAKYVSAGERGSTSAAANHAVVHTSKDGTPERVDAEGNVTLTSDSQRQGTVVSNKLELELGPKGQARAAHLFGNVRYVSDEEGKRAQGHAEDARVSFDELGRPVRSVMTGAVTFSELQGAGSRMLDAATVDLTLGGGGKAPTVVRSAQAFGPGGATLKLVDDTAKGRSSTDVKADTLTGRFVAGGKTTELAGLDGAGHSWVERVATSPSGALLSKDTSVGEMLKVDFTPGAKGRSELSRAEQRGGVVTVHEAAKKGGGTEVEHGRAEDSVYEAAANVVHMTGAVEVQDEQSALFADRVDVDRGTGDATANGAVKVTYVSGSSSSSQGSQEPVHVLAVRAVEHKGAGLAEFFGDAEAKARMWQGASQVEAPVIDLYRNEKKMVARGDAGSDAAAVRAVLIGASTDAKKKANGPMRVMSREMTYLDSARTVEFTGGVKAVDQDGTLTSNEATVWLNSDKTDQPEKGAGVGFMGGKVDHMIATGAVVLDQPGRKGTGEKLVYTASDGVFVLTGTKAAPPKVVDVAQGSTTGAALRFKRGDDSVEVVGSETGKTAGRVRSETRMRQ